MPAATEEARVSAAEMNELLEEVRNRLREEYPDRAEYVVRAFDRATQAMVDKMRGKRGITMKTWERYVDLLRNSGDWYRVMYGLGKAHWSPEVSA